ncbi:hypothetical protein E2562_032569 [Oryza meyeriana var. granulata]|uniref:Uncharacterized protein n=1 Tax=Oryza meyeriana var. granulata TaxID=110450 RepID=A0A6G1CWA9_9ORYZ|nr:hypothetical protein E2562_032569 [Oryza meyeriana var. granulata]
MDKERVQQQAFELDRFSSQGMWTARRMTIGSQRLPGARSAEEVRRHALVDRRMLLPSRHCKPRLSRTLRRRMAAAEVAGTTGRREERRRRMEPRAHGDGEHRHEGQKS